MLAAAFRFAFTPKQLTRRGAIIVLFSFLSFLTGCSNGNWSTPQLSPISPVLTFTTLPTTHYGAAPFVISASSASPGIISYSVVSGPALIVGSVVSVTGVGVVTLSAVQAAAPGFLSQTASTTFTVLPVQLSLAGSVPVILSAGTTTAITLLGTGLDQVQSLTINGSQTSFTLVSSTSLTANVNLEPWESGSAQFVATDSASSASFDVPLAVSTVPYDAAVRFLQQAGYGATPTLVAQVQKLGFSRWIDAEMNTPAYDYSAVGPGQYYRNTQNGALSLRQRVAFALEQIFVTGDDYACEASFCGAYWEALLEADAFGNVSNLLHDVALSPIMADYLNNANNAAGLTGGVANQNFAREFMQLMTIGTVCLNSDGSAVLDQSGRPVPTYDMSNVAAMASALSGWIQVASPPAGTLIMNEYNHDQFAKNILPGVTLPANQGGEADLTAVVTALFHHQNIAPFLSRRLIQHLVTSNPSPAYVSRIAAVFADDGNRVRGNLAAVVKAILLDPEARSGDAGSSTATSAGHLMEPILYLSDVMNSLGGQFTDDQVSGADATMKQGLYRPPSVFSFYSSDHQLADGVYAPEAQLLDNAHALAKLSLTYNITHQVSTGGFSVDLSTSPFWNATSSEDLLQRINHLLLHGTMSSAVHDTLAEFIRVDDTHPLNSWLPDVLFLTVSTSGFQVIH